MRVREIASAVVLLFCTVQAPGAAETVAVLDLEATGELAAQYERPLSDRLRSEMVKTGQFDVFERNRMMDILSEQGFQLSGCTSTECAVEAGRLLGVMKIFAGSVAKVGDVYTVNVRKIDVETGKIDSTWSLDCRCEIEELLTDRIAEIAGDIAGVQMPSTPSEADTTKAEYGKPWTGEVQAAGTEETVWTGGLIRSEKKTLFIFPTLYESGVKDLKNEDRDWAHKQFFETFVSTFERFDFVEMRGEANLDSFLANADQYMADHAREFVQKRKEPDGRIGEARVTLDDLIKAVKNGFVFVPVFDEIKIEKPKKDSPNYSTSMHIDIWRTSTREKIGSVSASGKGIGALVGAFKQLMVGNVAGKDDLQQDLHNKIDGMYEVMKNKIQNMDEFSLKSIAFDTGFSGFSIDLGKDFGVRMDRQYKVWSLNDEGMPYKAEGWGKVRNVEQDRSRIQLLIGSVGEGDQVIEYSKLGLHLSGQVGITPFKLQGFDEMRGLIKINVLDQNIVFALPSDASGDRAIFGLTAEYDIAWIIDIPELYLVAEGGWIPVTGMTAAQATMGIRKKMFFRRLGVWGTVKAGAIDIEFIDTDVFDNPTVKEGPDARVYGAGVDVGGEVLLTPDWSFRGQIGFTGFPKQVVLIVYDTSDGKWKQATISSAGVTFSFTLGYTF